METRMRRRASETTRRARLAGASVRKAGEGSALRRLARHLRRRGSRGLGAVLLLGPGLALAALPPLPPGSEAPGSDGRRPVVPDIESPDSRSTCEGSIAGGPAIGLGSDPLAGFGPRLASGPGSCAGDALDGVRDALDALEARILEAETLPAAREIATVDSRQAYAVLSELRRMAPEGGSLARAGERLERYHARVQQARSRSEIVRGLREVTFTSPSMDDGCDYTGAEIVAIVLGFILGIIPGLILLVLLC